MNIKAKIIKSEARIDSRVIAQGLGVAHKAVMQQIEKYKADIKTLGLLPFEMEKVKHTMGRPERFAYLNENQCYALIVLSKNTPKSVDLKFALVKAFSDARDAIYADINYLPCFHDAHHKLSQLVNQNTSSQPANIHHMNLEKMINKALGISAKSRRNLSAPYLIALSMAEHLAGCEFQSAIDNKLDHKVAYQNAKLAVTTYANTVVPALVFEQLPEVANG